MKLDLNKTTLVNLSDDDKTLPSDLTPQVGGGSASWVCSFSCNSCIACPPAPEMPLDNPDMPV